MIARKLGYREVIDNSFTDSYLDIELDLPSAPTYTNQSEEWP